MFSALQNRHSQFDHLQREKFDILVIGGGITGAGIALDASLRGLKVALIEKQDFASGTSSKSTKLIHGGLRYLKQLDFALVRETGKERAVAFANAPHLVYPEKMMLPIYRHGSMNYWAASAGIYLYDLLAGVPFSQRRKMLSAEKTLNTEPMLKSDSLIGAASYTEYRTDDAALTIEIMKSAKELGALCFNYMKAVKPIYNSAKIAGFEVECAISGEKLIIHSTCVINAAGPWTDELRKLEGTISGKHLKLTKGVHLVFPFSKLPVKQSCYVDVPADKGRMIFIIPRGRAVYAGTTDTFYDGNKDEPNTSLADAEYILKAVNSAFPEVNLSLEDVESSWSGLRPLIFQEGKSATELSRKDEIFISDSGMISIAGGKLTGYRKMAERAVDEAIQRFNFNVYDCQTEHHQLSGGVFENSDEMKKFFRKMMDECGQIPKTETELIEILNRYGSNSNIIIEKAYDIFNSNREHPNPLAEAEIWYSVNFENTLKPSDYFIRRRGILYFNRPHIPEILDQTLAYIKKYIGIDDFTFAQYSEEFRKEYEEVVEFTGK